ncbi:hypothetical protein TELCIR_23580, partial [Teladorsagia circumcincta]
TESSAQIAYDIWQLFGQFVHDSAPERIEFDEEIVTEFKAAVECNNLLLLDKIIEKSYQVVYQRMQSDHVVPFCQSDAFLGLKLRRAIAGVSSDSLESEESMGSSFSEVVDDPKYEGAASESGKEALMGRK